MSRIGIKPITLPAGVEVKVDGNVVSVKGPKGELQETISSLLTVENKDGVITVSRDGDEAEKRSQHGLARTLINNMVIGVTDGFQKKLQLVGVGYKAEKKGKKLVMKSKRKLRMPIPLSLRVSTKRWSETTLRISEPGESRSRTRARASGTKTSIFVVKKARPEPEHKERSEASWQEKAEMISVSFGTRESENSSAALLRNLVSVFSEATRTLLLRSSMT